MAIAKLHFADDVNFAIPIISFFFLLDVSPRSQTQPSTGFFILTPIEEISCIFFNKY